MSKSVSVPAELVERLRRMVENPMWHSHALWHAAARALVDAVERPTATEPLCTCGHKQEFHNPKITEPIFCQGSPECTCVIFKLSTFTPAPPSLPDRDEAPRPSISDEAEAAWEAHITHEPRWYEQRYPEVKDGFLAGFRAARQEEA